MLNFLRSLFGLTEKKVKLTNRQAAAKMKALHAEGFIAVAVVCNHCGTKSVQFLNTRVDLSGEECDDCGSEDTEFEFLSDEEVGEIIETMRGE